MKKLICAVLVMAVFTSFKSESIKGVWKYCGDMFNGERSAAPTAYTLQREYDKARFKATVLEPGEKPFTYESGDYTLKADTCFETQTYCAQESQLLNKTITYTYSINKDTLTFKGTLPSGKMVESYWKRLK